MEKHSSSFHFGGPTETCETNGAQNQGLKAGKCSLFEGVTRVESFVGGGLLSDDVAGKPMHRLMHGVNWLPTLAEAAGLNVSDSLTNLPLDGVSHWGNLLGQEDAEAREETFYGYSTGYPEQRQGSAIRNLRWKLMRGETTFNAPIRILPGSDGYCTPNCVNCSASKGYDFLDKECPKDIRAEAASPRQLTAARYPIFANIDHRRFLGAPTNCRGAQCASGQVGGRDLHGARGGSGLEPWVPQPAKVPEPRRSQPRASLNALVRIVAWNHPCLSSELGCTPSAGKHSRGVAHNRLYRIFWQPETVVNISIVSMPCVFGS